MKQRIQYLGLAAIVALSAAFTACSSDEPEVQNAEQQTAGHKIRLTSSLSQTRTTNADLQDTQLSTSVKVGAFGIAGGTAIANGNNNQYSVASNGDLTAVSTDMTWPESGSVSIYAYAPYTAGFTATDANAFSVKADQSSDADYLASDLVYGVPSSNPVAQTTSAISLNFTHKLAKVNVTVKKGTGSNAELGGATVNILNTQLATTFTPSTGAIAAASGAAQDIKAATFDASATTFTASAIIVPQQLASGTQFVRIVAGTSTLTAKLGSATTFEGGKAYNFTVNVGTVTPGGDTEVTLTLGSTAITNWDDINLGSADSEESEAMGIGDYVLADGTLVKASKLTTDQQSSVAAIIFSTTVSATDAAEGYNAYAMGLTRYKNRTLVADANNPEKMTTGAGNWAQGLADLDGRTNTATMLASAYYAARTDEEKAASIINLSGYTPAISGTNVSGWFLPSFGQMVQIMNQWGQAGITESLVADGDNISSGSAFYTSAEGVVTTLVANVQAAVPLAAADLFAVGNIVYATSTENNSTSSAHRGKFWNISLTSSDTYSFGKNTGRGTNSRSVIPVVAVKLPTE